MNTVQFLLPLLLLVFLFFSLPWLIPMKRERAFTIDWKQNCFLKDGDPFHYISGSLHYFLVPEEYWEDRMVKMRAAGLNAISTYIEWRSHEPSINEYNFEGMYNIVKYMQLAKKHNLLVIIRPGPYVGEDRDLGGLPSWLFKNNSSFGLRRNDPEYIDHVIRWFVKIFSLLTPYLYHNGGPIIMAQVESEYGSHSACDFAYMSYVRDLMRSLTRDKLVLFTTDHGDDIHLKCGKIDQVLATIALGPDDIQVEQYLRMLRSHQSNGPLVVSKYYSGRSDHWGEPHANVSGELVAQNLDRLLALDISVNIHMFHGGTSFDFGSGTDRGEKFRPQTTSYDFDAPLTESGDISGKYLALREVISKYSPVGEVPEPYFQPKLELESVAFRILDFDQIRLHGITVSSERPMTFEELGVTTGFVLYSTVIDSHPNDSVTMKISGLRDWAVIFVNNIRQGILSRMERKFELDVRASLGSRLDIFVGHDGRASKGEMIDERKGILGKVILDWKALKNWNHTFITDMSQFLGHLEKIYKNSTQLDEKFPRGKQSPSYPAIFQAKFIMDPDLSVRDSFLNLNNFTKGVAALNGHPLGRYWPSIGPQVTLYVPGVWINPYPGENILTIFEYEGTKNEIETGVAIRFEREPIFH